MHALSTLLRRTADDIDAGRHFPASYVAHRVAMHPVSDLVGSLPDDVLVLIVRWCLEDALPSVVLRWRLRAMAFCGRRAGVVLDAIVPNAVEVMRLLRSEKARLVATAIRLSNHLVLNEREGIGMAFRIEWTDGTFEYIWFLEEHIPLSVIRQKIRAHFRPIVKERDVLVGRLPVALAIHASVLRCRHATSPFEATDTFCILLHAQQNPRVIRWIDRAADRVVRIR